MSQAWLPLATLATSLLVVPLIFALPERAWRMRTALNLSAALLKVVLVALMVWGLYQGESYRFSFTVVQGVTFLFQVDALGLMFAGLSSLLWLATTVYAIGYLEDSPNRKRFFGFFSLCVASTIGIALAGNLFTFLLFYELLTLSTYPLVVHRGHAKALDAGTTYLRYTLTGGLVVLLGVVALHVMVGDVTFGEREMLADLGPEAHGLLTVLFLILLLGLGVKAALVPLHGWLPRAMVAPAPVSALLHAVAVVKAGAFGIVRLVYDVYGIGLTYQLGLLTLLAVIATVTILYGSMRALAQQELKPRLAFSTVSQVSYIVLGISLFGPFGTIAGLVHLMHQGLMKVTLFYCAGNYAEELGIHRIDQLDGAGRRMPLTSIAFTVGALGMIGLPPVAGFISKWYLGMGAVQANMPWVILVLVASSLLNAAYFLPILYRLWFRPGPAHGVGEWPQERRLGRFETSGWLLWPTVSTAVLSILAGLLAGLPFSPLDLASFVTAEEYTP
ncbi:proton-conducting transporter transmembrane domain-containing protein [Billgrantia desiderata]|uniref:Monovalent cation/H+ antiporter subunit D family protein n=1 Tax=Billgrantia desiderata TaxID=52021 RepID=A0AAW4YMW3_9GAMM|nr:proton-conducting transporter membrane subunit [Halomonas desiderata]MCE8028538.1 monovalent cation/H+ antiporter subunit D family protein [Halomonas desiderata]MCE8044196.1 monovalent cation/H+ antiporter subunit D family protein [Halomonas desiderata]MCE8048770.1 monovalent cation/H+ antiporter subunit D family protein [Halomonas desiderata]MCE8050031.1 monovalent cation/H+ antiporter subunit D family protein [Halomonas desiderata]